MGSKYRGKAQVSAVTGLRYTLVMMTLAGLLAGVTYADQLRSTQVNMAPAAPRITYPHQPTTGLSTNIAWMGDAFDSFEVRIGNADNPESADIWQSGEIASVEPFVKTPALPGSSTLHAFVRLHNAAGWGPWSAGSTVQTPESPVLEIVSPENAGRVRGSSVEIQWRVESDKPIAGLSVGVDGGEFRDVAATDTSTRLTGLTEGVHTVIVRATSGGKTRERTVTFYVYRLVQASGTDLYTLDLTGLREVNVEDPEDAANAFETLHIVGALQGLVNRDRPRLYIDYMAVDQFWLAKMREEGAYLEHAKLVPLAKLEDAIGRFKDSVKGVVVWDPELPCTSNIASTICGVESLLPVRYDPTPGSMYDRLVENGPRLNVVHNLVGKFPGVGKIPDSDRDSTGSRKCDAYIWAKMQYIDSGKCNPLEVGYWCDAFWLKAPADMSLNNVGLTNADYIIARKGFICDLDCWTDEAPRDDPDQRFGLDRETLMEILLSCYKRAGGKMIHFAGFTPWAIKYTDHKNAGGKHGGVPTEWETSRILSAYDAYLDADAIGSVGMANASVFSHYPLPDRMVQNPPPTREQLESKGYIDADGSIAPLNFVHYYLGDYDSAAWMYGRLPRIWQSTARGKVPSGWAFNASLSDRMPVVFDWVYETKTPADYFVSGDSGSGYVNPTELMEPRDPSGLPSGVQSWIDHNIPYFRKFNYSIVTFIINGFCGKLSDESNAMYLPFSADGIMTQPVWMPEGKPNDHLLKNMPVALQLQDISPPTERAVEQCVKHGKPSETAFLSYRCILQPPDWVQSVNEGMRSKRPECRFEPVDPYTYFYLLRHKLNGRNEMRATYTFDTMPSEVKTGQMVRVTVGLRNDGWDTWAHEGDSAVVLKAGFSGRSGGIDVPLPGDVKPGEATVVTFELAAPGGSGRCEFSLELRRGKNAYFGDAGDMPWRKDVEVR